jgi:hypothetical protein
MKIKTLLIFVFFSMTAYAQDEKECIVEGEIERLANSAMDLNFPCSRGQKDIPIYKILSKADDNVSIQDFCEKCKEPQILTNNKLKTANFNSENKKQFAQATLNELRKNLSGTMIDLMSLRSTFSINFNPEEAAKSCSTDQLAKSTCKDGTSLQEIIKETLGEQDSFQNIQKQLGYEIANTLNPPPYKENGLLSRQESSCGISDNELLNAKMKYWESLMTPELINVFQTNNVDFEKINTFPESTQESIKEMSQHPMIKALLKDGKKMNAFIKSFKGKQVTQDTITKHLFSDSNSKNLANELGNRCKTAFETIKTTFCSTSFKEGNVLFSDLSAMKMNLGKKPLNENKEENLYSFCYGIKTKTNKPILFQSVNENLSQNLPEKFQKLNHKQLSEDFYNDSFHTPKEDICPLLVTQTCDIKSMNCSISKFLKASRVPNSPQSKLLASHDPNIDRILGSLIGSAPTVDTKTRTFLTEQGILPKADGTIVESKDNQIRNPSTYSSSVKSFEEKAGPTPQLNNPTQINQTAKTDSPESWKGADVNNSTSDENNAETSGFPKKKNKKSNFDSLAGDLDNNDEFKDKFTDRLNKLKNKNSLTKNKSGNDEQDEEEDYVSGEKKYNSNTVLNGSSNIQSGSGTITTPLTTPTQTFSGHKSGNVATIDKPGVQETSINKAMREALDRSPANGSIATSPKISLSKNDNNQDEINIMIPDENKDGTKIMLNQYSSNLEESISNELDKLGTSLISSDSKNELVLKLGNYTIKLVRKDVYSPFMATQSGNNLHPHYVTFLLDYFNNLKNPNPKSRVQHIKSLFKSKNPEEQTNLN